MPSFQLLIQIDPYKYTAQKEMGLTASCLAAPSPPAEVTILYEAPAPQSKQQQQLNVQLAFAYASRPGTAHSVSPPSSRSSRHAFTTKRQLQKENQVR